MLPQYILQFLGLLSLILMVLMCFFLDKIIIAKQFEYSQIIDKHMCIFHVLTFRGLSGSEGLPCRVWGFREMRKTPGYAPDSNDIHWYKVIPQPSLVKCILMRITRL